MSLTLAQLRMNIRRNLRETERFTTPLAGTVTIEVAVGDEPRLVTGTSTAFLTEIEVGQELQVENEIRVVSRIDSDTVLYVNQPFAEAHTSATPAAVTPRAWADEEITDALNSALTDLGDEIVNRAPALVRYGLLGNLTAGTRLFTIPAANRILELVEILPYAGAPRYQPIGEVALRNHDQPVPSWTGWGIGAGDLTGLPTGYTVISPTQLEWNITPSVTITNGVRVYGPVRLQPFLGEADPLRLAVPDGESDYLDLPDGDSLDCVLEHWATARLLRRDRTVEQSYINQFEVLAANGVQTALAKWSTGRGSPVRRVALLR